MGEVTNNAKKKAEKLNQLVEEMERMDAFRQKISGKNESLMIKVNNVYGGRLIEIDTDDFESLRDNVAGLVEIAFNKRYKQITKILSDEFGGAYTEISDD